MCELCTLYCSVQQGSIRMAGGGGCVTHMEPGGILLGALYASLINSVCAFALTSAASIPTSECCNSQYHAGKCNPEKEHT